MTVAWPGELGPSGSGAGGRSLRRQHRRQQRAQQVTVIVWLVFLSLALAVVLGFGWIQAQRLTGESSLGPSPAAPVLPDVRGA